jgi:3'-5' exoribonuclease
MPDASHVNVRDLKPNTYIEGVYSLVNPQVGATRNGKSYLKGLIRDATGEAAVRQWNFDESQMPEATATGYAYIAGRVELYNGMIQVMLDRLDAVQVSPDQLSALLPASTKDVGQMFADASAILRSLRHPAMRALMEAYLGDEPLMDRFRHAPAAVSVHHAWLGGLLEHTLQLMNAADRILPLYPGLNRDIVIAGLFLHDLGKVYEMDWERGFSYTTDGQLIGHIVRGAIMLQLKAAVAARESGNRLPPDAVKVLQHIILSHHSLPEHGAAKPPSTPEAIFVAMLDNLDAKTTIGLAAAARDRVQPGHADFTDRVWSLDTRIYRRDPLAPDAATDADTAASTSAESAASASSS